MFEIFNILFTNPLINFFVALYHLLNSVGIPFAFGFSIIALTALIRLVLYPFTAAQIKSAYKMQKVTPHINAMKAKYKDDKKRQQEEMMKLYKEHGVNPAAGCLPMIIQLPIIWALYHVLTIAVNINSLEGLKSINNVLYSDSFKLQRVWDTTFFGMPLGVSPSSEFSKMPLLILIPVVTGLLQLVLSKMMMPEEALSAETKLAKATKGKSDDFQVAFQKQSLFIFPVMIGFFSFTLPLGLSLYWNTYTIFGILQQYLLVGPGGAKGIFAKVKINGKNK